MYTKVTKNTAQNKNTPAQSSEDRTVSKFRQDRTIIGISNVGLALRYVAPFRNESDSVVTDVQNRSQFRIFTPVKLRGGMVKMFE